MRSDLVLLITPEAGDGAEALALGPDGVGPATKQCLDVVGSGISGEVEIVIHVSRRRFGVSNDGVAHRPSDQVEGVAGRPKAVGQVGSCFDQWPQALGEHAPKVVRLT